MKAKFKRQGGAAPLREVYEVLRKEWGAQDWWPARTRFEVIVGAILTQNTAWTNVEKALVRLRAAKALTPAALHAASLEQVEEWIRPSGFYRIKARRLRAFTDRLFDGYGGRLSRLFALDTAALRAELLSIHGIGPETADSILLYAAGREQFVVDAYTRRLVTRHEWLPTKATYDEVAALFVEHGPSGKAAYNEFHALIVQLGKTYCRPTPRCEVCPLQCWLPDGLTRARL